MYQNIYASMSNYYPTFGRIKSVHGVLNMNHFMEYYIGHELGESYRKLIYNKVMNDKRRGLNGLESVVDQIFHRTPIDLGYGPVQTNIYYNDRMGDIVDCVVHGFGNDLFKEYVVHGYKSLHRREDGSSSLYCHISLLDSADEETYLRRIKDGSVNVLHTSNLLLHPFMDIIVDSVVVSK